jgi:uncharacterized protein (TIGR03083 family)
MFDLATAAQATQRDLAAIIGRLDGLADAGWNAPVRCQGWQVPDLAAHLVGACRGQAEGLRRAAEGTAASAGLARLAPPPDRDPRSLLAALKDGQDRLLPALAEFPPAALEGAVPLPFGLVPAAVALQIVPLEYGFHRNDLEWALGDPADLSPDMSATLLSILPGLLPMLAAGSPVHGAGDRPSGPVSFRLVTPSARYLVSYAAGGWSIAPDDGQAAATCQITGDDSPVALFVMGRISADHPSLTVTDPAAAGTFKQYFPGP